MAEADVVITGTVPTVDDARPTAEALAVADDVVDAIRREAADRGAAGAYLDGIAPNGPLVIIHNSGHQAYFNSRAARLVGLTRDTPDPKGARFGRDAHGELDGTAEETGAVFPLLEAAIEPGDYPAMLRAECARLNRAGLTTCRSADGAPEQIADLEVRATFSAGRQVYRP